MTQSQTKSRRGAGCALVGSIILASLLSACGSSNSATAPKVNGVTTITLGELPSTAGQSISYAAGKGYFTKHHLDVKLQELNGGAAGVPALESGAIQVSDSNLVSALQGVAKGVDTPCFAGFLQFPKVGNIWPILVDPKSAIRSASDLVGKTVAVSSTGSISDISVKAWLESQGVDYTKVKIISTPYPNMPQALSSGQIQAALAFDPFAAEMIAAGDKPLTNNPVINVKGDPGISCFVAKRSWLDNNKSVATEFKAALKDVFADISADPDAFRAYVGKQTKIDPTVLAKVTLPKFSTDLSVDDIGAWQKAGAKYGILDYKVTGIDPAKVYDSLGG